MARKQVTLDLVPDESNPRRGIIHVTGAGKFDDGADQGGTIKFDLDGSMGHGLAQKQTADIMFAGFALDLVNAYRLRLGLSATPDLPRSLARMCSSRIGVLCKGYTVVGQIQGEQVPGFSVVIVDVRGKDGPHPLEGLLEQLRAQASAEADEGPGGAYLA